MKNFSTALLATLAAAAGQTITCGATNTTSLRFEADKGDILIGSGAINPNYLNDTRFATTLAEQFKSLSPENEMKWSFLHPTPDHYNWYNLDRLVDFADEHGMVVKGHGLISGCCNPEYLLDITDPVEFRAAMKTHFEAIMHRYEGRMDRWDVVTEILMTQGGGIDTENNFYKILGPQFVQIAFEVAREAAPNAKLFLCENLVETLPGKRKELYDLVSDLVAVGAPIDGVALQMHITLVAPVPGVITEMVNSYHDLGLEVAISEMDVHTLNDTQQTEIYGNVIEEALEAGITDISFWGFTDKHAFTWLPGAKPLMFDEKYQPKGSFYATHDALATFANSTQES